MFKIKENQSLHYDLLVHTRSLLQRRWIWIVIAAFWGLVIVKTIVDGEILYTAIVVTFPLLLYLFVHKPFIFPFGLYVFSLPFENLLSLVEASKGPTLSKLLAVLSIFALALKGYFQNKLKGPDGVTLWWVLFMLYAFSSIAWGISPAGTMRLSTALGLIVLYLIVSSYQIQKREYEQLKWILIIAGVIAALLTIHRYQMVLAIKGVSDRTSIIINDRFVALNSLPFDLLFTVSLCMAMIINQKKAIMKGLFFLFVVIVFFAIILTGSRGGLSAALSIVILYLLFIRNLSKKIVFALVISLGAVIIFPLIPEFMHERIRDSVDSHASGRTDIWIVGLHSLKKYWLFGAGLDNFPLAYTEFIHSHNSDLGLNRAPHSLYVGFFVELGIIGILLMFTALIKHYKLISASNVEKSDQIMLKATFWAVMINCLTGDMIWSKMFWFLFMMIIMHKHAMRRVSAPPVPASNLYFNKI